MVRVWLLDGEEAWVLVHVEVQGQYDSLFPKRMYTYNVINNLEDPSLLETLFTTAITVSSIKEFEQFLNQRMSEC